MPCIWFCISWPAVQIALAWKAESDAALPVSPAGKWTLQLMEESYYFANSVYCCKNSISFYQSGTRQLSCPPKFTLIPVQLRFRYTLIGPMDISGRNALSYIGSCIIVKQAISRVGEQHYQQQQITFFPEIPSVLDWDPLGPLITCTLLLRLFKIGLGSH